MDYLPMLDEKTESYPHLIVKHFGYQEDFLEEFYAKNKKKGMTITDTNETHRCLMCGNVIKKGLIGKDIAKQALPRTYNEAYCFVKDNSKEEQFICAYCLYSAKNYVAKKMQSIIVFKDRYEKLSIKGDKNNTMYEYIMNESDKDFIMMINTRGQVLENMTYLALPTIAKSKIVTIVYGMSLMYIDRDKLKSCLNDTVLLMKEFNLKKNFVTNSEIDSQSKTTKSESRNRNYVREVEKNKELGDRLKKYYLNYDRDTRVIASKLYDKYVYLNKQKEKK